MSHIKLKPHTQFADNPSINKVLNNSEPAPQSFLEDMKKRPEEKFAIVKTKDNRLMLGLPFEKDGEIKIIIEPSPVVTFFSIAHQYVDLTEKAKTELFEKSEFPSGNADENLKASSKLISYASIATTFMFNSMEACMNILIEHFGKELKYDKEIVTKDYILKRLSFDEKVKRILPQMQPKSFHVLASHKYEKIKQLQDYRDSVMHFKVDTNDKLKGCRLLVSTAINFDFVSTLKYCREFINFYWPELIENCDCGA